MNTNKMIFWHCMLLFLLNSTCSKDDGPPDYSFTVEDFETEMNENPMLEDLIGTIRFESDPGSQVRFSVTSQSHANAMRVTLLGELHVVEPSVYDFETNPILSATIKCEHVVTVIADGGFREEILGTRMITVIINLRDLED